MKGVDEVVIVHGRNIGAIKTVSDKISVGLLEKKIKHSFFNMSDYGRSMPRKIFNSFLELKKKNKNNLYVYMHFDPIMIGVLMTFFGFKKKINVIHTDLVEYYSSLTAIRKIIFYLVLTLIKKEFLVFVSREAELKAKQFFRFKNTATIYNIYDFHSEEDRGVYSYSNQQIILGSISRLDSRKNIDLIIRVLKEIVNQGIKVKLLIYGAGEEEHNIIKYIQTLNAESFVELKGEVFDKKLMYNSIDALVSLSSYEGFGLTIVESIDFGKPVFYTDCSSGPREIMLPDTNPLIKTTSYDVSSVGYLVRPIIGKRLYAQDISVDEKIYVESIQLFLSDLQNNKFSMQFDGDVFSSKVVIEQWENLINLFGNFYEY